MENDYAQPINATLINKTAHLSLYLINQNASLIMESDDFITFSKASYQKINALHYEIHAAKKYVVFAKTYAPAWTLDGKKPLENYPVNVYEHSGEGKLAYHGFSRILIGYAVSIIFLGILLSYPLLMGRVENVG